MWRSFRISTPLAIATIAFFTVMATPAWALIPQRLPASGAAGIAGLAIIATLVAAKLWRRK